MGGDLRLCTILVHLRSESEYYDDMRKKQEEAVARAEACWVSGTGSRCGFTDSRSRQWAELSTWRPPWRYNDIVAFLEVVCEPSGTVVAYLWRVDARRVSRRLARKRFVWYGKCAEAWPEGYGQDDAEGVRAAALECIARATRELARQGWHADVAEATRLLRCARFDELLSTLEKRSAPDDPGV
jgi:hypothetical protein